MQGRCPPGWRGSPPFAGSDLANGVGGHISHAGVAEVWLVNLVQQRVTIYRRPSPAGYQEVRAATPGETVSPQSFPELEISVGELLG